MQENDFPTLGQNNENQRWFQTRFFRFLIASICALVMTLMLLLFMRFLIAGYEGPAGDVMTRYLGIRTQFTHVPPPDDGYDIDKPGPRPTDEPEVIFIEEDEEENAIETSLIEFIKMEGDPSEASINPTPSSPEQAQNEISDQEIFKLLKQSILDGDDE